MTATTVAITYSTGSENLTTYVLVEDGITIKRGKQTAFGRTEVTTCEFSANRSIMKTAAWRLATRTTETITVVVNGSTRFTGWWWRSEEDIFDERGVLRITLASSALKALIEDTRELRFSTRSLPDVTDSVLYCPLDQGLLELGRFLDNQGVPVFSGTVWESSEASSGTPQIQDPPNNIPQLRSGPRNTYTTDSRYTLKPATTVAVPFQVFWVMNAYPSTIGSSTKVLAVRTENMEFGFGTCPSGTMWVTATGAINVCVDWAARTTSLGELWLVALKVESSGANVVTTVTVYPLSRAEGTLGNLAGTVVVSDTSAAPAAGIGNLEAVEFGPYVKGLATPDDLLLSDILVTDSTTLTGSAVRLVLEAGLHTSTLTASYLPYYGITSTVNSGSLTPLCPTIPPGTGAEQLAAIEEVHRTVVADSRTADLTTIRGTNDYVPMSVTELALGNDYLHGLGSGGEEGELDVLIPDGSYPLAVDPYGAQWQRNRSRRWARLPVNLDSANKRAVDVGASYVSFFTRPGNIWRGRVVGIEEYVTPAMHTAFWVLEEWPTEAQIVADSARARPADGSALAATVNATYSGGGSLTVNATYAYTQPFTVRPAAASKYYLVISSISGTTWTINTGASSLPPSMAVGDLLNFDSPGVAF